MKRKPRTEEHSRRLSESIKRAWARRKEEEEYVHYDVTDETRQKMSDAKKGVPKSEAHRKAMSEAQKAKWAERKAAAAKARLFGDDEEPLFGDDNV